MINRLRTLIWRLRLRLLAPDAKLAALLFNRQISPDQVRTGRIHWPRECLDTDFADELFFLEGAVHLPRLRTAGAKWHRAEDGGLLLTVGGVTLAPGSAEEMLIAAEIFHDGIYHFRFGRPTVVIDIGANVCTAALTFSTDPHVLRVHAYEPLPANLTRARANLALNPELAPKIVLHPWGLGATTREQEMAYDPSLRGSASLRTAPAAITRLATAAGDRIEHARVSIRSAADTIEELSAAHPSEDLWLKIDCEGAEDEITPVLALPAIKERIRGLIMETHEGNGPAQEKILAEAGFTVWRPEPLARDLGYLLAFRL